MTHTLAHQLRGEGRWSSDCFAFNFGSPNSSTLSQRSLLSISVSMLSPHSSETADSLIAFSLLC